jgi:hypothetical protein
MPDTPALAVITGMRLGRLDPASVELPGDDLHLGLATQLEVLDWYLEEGEALGGWKVARACDGTSNQP